MIQNVAKHCILSPARSREATILIKASGLGLTVELWSLCKPGEAASRGNRGACHRLLCLLDTLGSPHVRTGAGEFGSREPAWDAVPAPSTRGHAAPTARAGAARGWEGLRILSPPPSATYPKHSARCHTFLDGPCPPGPHDLEGRGAKTKACEGRKQVQGGEEEGRGSERGEMRREKKGRGG